MDARKARLAAAVALYVAWVAALAAIGITSAGPPERPGGAEAQAGP